MQVRGSAESAKRGFLEKKGLTAAEIDEAFKRVPPEATSTPTVAANNLVTYTQPQQQAPQHVPAMASQALVPAQVPAQQMLVPQRPPVHWSQVGLWRQVHAGPSWCGPTRCTWKGHRTACSRPPSQLCAAHLLKMHTAANGLLQVVLGVGVAAAGLYGLHQLLYPRLSAWSQQLFSARSAAAEAEAERLAALTTALERLSEGQARLQESLDSLAAAVSNPQRPRPDPSGFAESHADYLALPGPSGTRRPQQYSANDTYASSSRAAAVRGGGWDPYASDPSSQHYPPEGRPSSAASPSGRNPVSGFYGSSATGFEVTPPPMGTYRAPQPPAQYGNAGSSSNAAAGAAPGADPGYARRAGAYAGGPEASAAGG